MVALIEGDGAPGVLPEEIFSIPAEVEIGKRPLRKESVVEACCIEERVLGCCVMAARLQVEPEPDPCGCVKRMEGTNMLPVSGGVGGLEFEIGHKEMWVVIEGVEALSPAEVWKSAGGFEEGRGELRY